MEQIEVSKKIMKTVMKKDKDKRRVNMCLGVEVCPKCGRDLNKIYGTSRDNYATEYKCTACDFTATI